MKPSVRLVLASLGAALLVGCRCASAPYDLVPADDGPLDARVGEYRILTWNTWLMPFYPSKPARRAEEIAVAAQGYDIVGLQEVFLQRDKIIRRLQETYRVIDPDPALKKRVLGSGLLLATKFEVEDWWAMRYEDAVGDDAFATKSALYVRLVLLHGRLDVVVTHFQAGTTKARRAARAKQLKSLNCFIAEHALTDVPRIIMGDLNVSAPSGYDPTHSAEYMALLAGLSFASKEPIDEFARLQPPSTKYRYADITYDYRNNTWHAPLGSVDDDVIRLDYLLNHNPDARANVTAVRVRRFWYETTSGRHCPTSDHYAIEAVLDEAVTHRPK